MLSIYFMTHPPSSLLQLAFNSEKETESWVIVIVLHVYTQQTLITKEFQSRA